MKRHASFLAACGVLLLAACDQSATPAAPGPAVLTDAAIGYYCGMMLSEHAGPKAQIFVEGRSEPYWFSQVRDGVHFLRAPEETSRVRAAYVTDYAGAGRDRAPRWIAAADAYFVIDSATMGGMGAPEAVPFSTAEAAALYRGEHGGRMVRLSEIPDAYIDAPYTPQMGDNAHDGHH